MTSNAVSPVVVRDLRKSYGDHEVLKGVSFEVPAGSRNFVSSRRSSGSEEHATATSGEMRTSTATTTGSHSRPTPVTTTSIGTTPRVRDS